MRYHTVLRMTTGYFRKCVLDEMLSGKSKIAGLPIVKKYVDFCNVI